ncbi:MAG: response regulator [Candidatus Omnitrophica bacterium]|nr:response regulator [Candidatus Omnitrophota bacterium]
MKKNILVVDDDVELCEEISEILKDEGYLVETACDVAQGIQRAQDTDYDIIILDYKMSGLTGVDFLKLVREKRIKSKIFVASGRPFVEKLLKDEGVADLVSYTVKKPFDMEFLLRKIKASR